MRLLVLFGLVVVATVVSAQKIPFIKSQGKSIAEFIPAGWYVKDSVAGDLNKDKQTDVVLVLQCADSANIVKFDGLGADELDTNRRILLILFSQKDGYSVFESTSTFILNHTEPTIDDPYDGIKIVGDVLHITFRIFANAGSWFVAVNEYKFQFRNNAFNLIGAEALSFHRGSGDSETHSYNFLTRKKQITAWNEGAHAESVEAGKKPPPKEVRLERIKVKQLKTFTTFIAPFTWDEDNISL